MTGEFPNPYEREAVERYEISPPPPLDVSDYDQISKIPVLDTDQTLVVVRFQEGTDLPVEVAEHLKYKTETDCLIMTNTADDRYRFGDVNETVDRFLRDQGGRRLYCAIDEATGELCGVIWLHPIEGGQSGHSLILACEQFNQKHPDETPINPAKYATLASRIYNGTRGKKTHTPFVLDALGDYYAQWPDCEGTIIRLAKNDGNAMIAFGEGNGIKNRAEFVHIHSEEDVAFMINRGIHEPPVFPALAYDIR